MNSFKQGKFGLNPKQIIMKTKHNKINRKQFLKNSILASAGILASSCSRDKQHNAPAIITKKRVRWRMVTTWPANFPVLGEGCNKLAEWVEEMSDGNFTIKVYGSGELAPPLETFDAVSDGSVEMGNGAAYYWGGKMPAAPIFCSIPFGMNAQQMNAWIYGGDGYQLWKDLYAPFDVIPFAGGNTGPQMGGWFNKKMNTVDDFKGLKMRMPGLGGKVIEKLGAAAVVSPGSEIYTNLERGVIDATEWVGPYHDYLMGFYKIAKYYYTPGWHEPGPVLENIINREAWENLPKTYQSILKAASARQNIWSLSVFEAKNNEYLNKIKNSPNVEILRFSQDILDALQKASNEVMEELCAQDTTTKKIYENYLDFKKRITQWNSYAI